MAVQIKQRAGRKIEPAKIKLENLVQFNGNCIDPLALVIVSEALDFAIESSSRRIQNVGKIFPQVKDSAIGSREDPKIMNIIAGIRDALITFPICPKGTASVVNSPPANPPIVPGYWLTEEMTKKIGDEVRKVRFGTKPHKAPSETEVKKRALPELWGKVTFERRLGASQEYDSPTQLAKELRIKTDGARNIIHAFERAGYKVSGNGEPRKGGKLTVTKVGETPAKYIQEMAPEEVILGLKKEPRKEEKEPYGSSSTWIVVKKEGKVLRWETATGTPIPKELWP